MTFKLLNVSKFLFSLFSICNLTMAQNVSESINVGEINISSNFSVQGANPLIISLKAKAELPVALIENYLNQYKDVRVESEGDISFSGLLYKTTKKSPSLTLISKNSGLIDGSKMYSSKDKLNINVITEGSFVFSSKAPVMSPEKYPHDNIHSEEACVVTDIFSAFQIYIGKSLFNLSLR